MEQETRPIWTNAVDSDQPVVAQAYGRATEPAGNSLSDFRATIFRWRDDFQNDFAARMEWTTRPFNRANHPPIPTLDTPAAMTVQSGGALQMRAHAIDPDRDSVSYFWLQYPEAGTYRGAIDMGVAHNMPVLHAIAPHVDRPETLHFILRVTDKGSPALSRYRRIVVTVSPGAG